MPMTNPVPVAAPAMHVHAPNEARSDDSSSTGSSDGVSYDEAMSDDSISEENNALFDNVPNVDEPIHEGDGDVEYQKLGVILLQLLDWMTTHKCTDRSTEDVWKMLRSLLPDASRSDVPTFSYIKRLISNHVDTTIEKIDMCINGCVAFYDYVNDAVCPPGRAMRKLSHRTRCPLCNEDRYIDIGGKQVSRYVFYYL